MKNALLQSDPKDECSFMSDSNEEWSFTLFLYFWKIFHFYDHSSKYNPLFKIILVDLTLHERFGMLGEELGETSQNACVS